ncbi:GlcG/HbpS family heme-binding protein [Jiangella endophytica]|uniref:GlcG/HbpS family heme-binding protein n=1 Tax=Jiangella endophytica TaxID=1623398 RepID=UPI000E34EDD1|nr:heme-binding protein [Jiangella endophytica]
MSTPTDRPVVDGDRALAAVTHGARLAAEQSARVTICVVDRAGVIASYRHHDAVTASLDLAAAKARAAAGLAKPSGDIGAGVVPGAPFYGLAAALSSPIATFDGGFPIVVDGHCCGAVGVSGASSAADVQIAQAALAAYHDAG